MTRKLIGVLVLAVAVMAWAAPIQAAPIVAGDTIRLSYAHGNSGSGGPWNVALASGGAALFETFCLEINEHLTLGSSLVVEAITTGSVRGGAEGNPDLLNDGTVWLYTRWSQGLIAHTLQNGMDVQRAIWAFEEPTTGWGVQNAFYNAAVSAVGSGTATDFGSVRVMNMTGYSGTSCNPTTGVGCDQDVLIYVPEPASMLLFGSGLAGLAAMVRRRKQR